MRVAIANDNGNVGQHFGNCGRFTVFNINYFVGINSTVDEAIDLFLNNELKSDDKACTEHKHCNH